MMKDILVLDDEKDILNLYTDILKDMGLVATATQSPLEALKILKAMPQKFKMLLMDHDMPELNGIEFVKRLAETNIKPVIVVSSGVLKPDDAKFFLDFSSNIHLLSKPIDWEKFEKLIRMIY